MPARNHIEVIEKAVRVLESLAGADGGKSLKDIAAEVGLVKSSAFRILYTFKSLGYVERSAERGNYALSLKVLALARGAAGKATLTNAARPHIERLRDELGESVWLAERRGDRVYLIEEAEGYHPLRLSLHRGDPSPLHASAVGKAIAAYLPDSEREAALGDGPFTRYTGHTLTDKAAVMANLAEVRKLGYAVNDEETIEGAILVGAPIFDAAGRVCAGIALSAPKARCTPGLFDAIVRCTKCCARDISAALAELGVEIA
ncbi:MAG: IclR family transcriptional regulator [Bryobacteraceae bacterium]|nr:IclR family transcriptional regulator [Bryobacteraceae bacterium]